jgi:excinuclease ABC subunit C
MKDVLNDILYIGKAVSLKNRVRQYFRNSSGHSQRISLMAEKIYDIDIILTDSELEALILECNLIKKHKPKYNVSLKDDKSYSFIKVTISDEYPKILFTRRIEKDNARYFGPYLSSGDVRETLELIRQIFPIRSCNKKIGTSAHSRPCLYYHIKQCQGLCRGNIDKDGYRLMVMQVCRFLEGKYEILLKELRSRMFEAAESLEFERAAVLRNRIASVERTMEEQKIVSTNMHDQDVLAFAKCDGETIVQILFIRNGAVNGSGQFVLEKTQNVDMGEIIESFIKQFYISTEFVPTSILLQQDIEDSNALSKWLSNIKGSKVRICVARKGEKKELMDMALRNAQHGLNELVQKNGVRYEKTVGALRELAKYVGLAGIPNRIEAFDISNLQGAESVGSMVVFEAGNPIHKDYRRFKIKGMNGSPDDFASIAQVVGRRFKRGIEEKAKLENEGKDSHNGKFSKMPNLVMVDGGKGQLNASIAVLKALGINDIPVIGLAKELEEVFIEGESASLDIPRDSNAIHLLQRIRDEAHRFAITYHRSLRNSSGLHSILESIPNIGKKRRIALFKHFGSIDAIKAAGIEDLEKITGMNRKAAQSLYEYFR